ncbi:MULTISPECIES: ABC transporter permease [unclassified Massilia]|uniref:ABC transporter permease n=1 Tax=unclassified Massilia TaxID=2609279 RepID=UPI001784A2B6|nr:MULTISPECIES: ABC transporter permease [unclassified Massilia]MBD8529984.1 ABC transporter permease [Massilia sp. CFBP 13647]MBD8673902.1 ABC transporter permease [Massilia sp. CFBP 13721]
MMNTIAAIFWKDLRETLRDRRNIVRMFVMPCFLIPLLGHFFLQFAEKNSEQLDKTELTYTIVGAAHLPELAKLYADDSSLRRVDVPEAKIDQAIRDKTIRFAVKIPADARRQLGSGGQLGVSFVYYQSAPSHALVKERGTAPLAAFSEKQRDWRLAFLGSASEAARNSLLTPLTFEVRNIATDQERIGHNLGTIIAYPLFIICFMGCAFTAVELATGEREKGTMEILVMMPVARTFILLGKFLVVFVLGLLYSTISMVSLASWLVVEGMQASETFKTVLSQIGVGDMLLVWLMLVPVTAVFSAVLLAISVYARSYREANSFSSIANLLVVVLATAIFVPGVGLTWFWSMIPVSNVGLVIRELIKGSLSNYLMIGSIFGTTIVIGAAALAFSIAWFRREGVIFRD